MLEALRRRFLGPRAGERAAGAEEEPAAAPPRREFSAAEIGAIAHLYRAEIYRSTVWRTRLDSTTNWAVVTTGIALSATYSSTAASPLPLALVGLLVSMFLLLEARRYRYFNIWRARARLLETDFYTPMLRAEPVEVDSHWSRLLARDYCAPRYHVSLARALGRRLRRTYAYIFLIQAGAYYGKLAIHPTPLSTLSELWARAAIGPIPGESVVVAGLLFHSGWMVFAYVTHRMDVRSWRIRRSLIAVG
ncbi:MAG: DUF2270 domain-containing protein [Gammaproteobacteria bacterium]|nr:DUF2270 domain-containing protein [Gammaproteobacteria bacterium]